MTFQVPFKKTPPTWRTIVKGIWSDILNDWSDSFYTTDAGTWQKVQSTDFFTEIRLGKIPGFEISQFAARSTSLNGTLVDLWGSDIVMTYPAAAETWVASSDSADDTLGGIGANAISGIYLDNNYVEQSATINLDGLNDVVVLADGFRPREFRVIATGSQRTNVGKIVIRKQGTPIEDLANHRNIIEPRLVRSQDGHLTTPAGKTLIFVQTVTFVPKNDDTTIRGMAAGPGVNTPWEVNALLDFYQSGVSIDIKARLPLPEKFDFRMQATSSNPETRTSLLFEYMTIENEYLSPTLLAALSQV